MAQKNPFTPGGAGENAFKAAYDRLKAEADLAKQNIGQNYSAAYQQLRQQGYGMGLGVAAQKGLSGGQAAGVRQQISAQQMGSLGNLMQGQERALREQKTGEASIYSNALLEGQQAQEMETTNRQAALAQQQQANAIIADKKLSEQQKYDQLITLGVDANSAKIQSGLGDIETYGDIGLGSAGLGAHINQINYTIEVNSKPVRTAQERQAQINRIKERIESSIREATENFGLTRQQAINRIKRKGIAIEQYGY